VGASANGSALDGGTLLVNWGLVGDDGLDAGSNGQKAQQGSGEVHYGFGVGGAEAIDSRRKKGFLSNE
jgi:hypothetical protein